MENFLVKMEMLEKTDEPRMRTVKLLVMAISYTDAEKTATQFYEDNFKKEDYTTPRITKISGESVSRLVDSLTKKNYEDGSDAYAKVFRLKVAITYPDTPMKRIGKVFLVKGLDIDAVIKKSQKYAIETYSADTAEVIEVKETDFYAGSEVFVTE